MISHVLRSVIWMTSNQQAQLALLSRMTNGHKKTGPAKFGSSHRLRKVPVGDSLDPPTSFLSRQQGVYLAWRVGSEGFWGNEAFGS